MDEEKSKSFGKKILTIAIVIITTVFILFSIVLTWVLIKNPLNARGIILYKLGWIDTPVQIVPAVNRTENIITEDKIDVQTKEGFIKTTPEIKTTPTTQTVPSTQAIPMTQEQRKSIEDFGIDPDSIVITPAMEDCFLEKLGEERVDEIKQGATPGILEMIKVSSCL